MTQKLYKIIPVLFLLPTFAAAQNSITFTAETTTGVESVVPVLTWSTEPAADNCQASGDWSGAKGAAGTETLPAITSSATYNLDCTWSDTAVTLSWVAPTQNTDGSALTDLDGYMIYYGTVDGGPYINSQLVDPTVTTYVIEPLSAGTWHFVATAVNARGVESDFTNQASKVLGDTAEQRSVGITVNPKPNPPSPLTAD